MIAVDTNILVYAHRRGSEWNEAAFECIRQLAESQAPWAIPWPCLHEFYAIATHPDIYQPPTSRDDATAQIDCWLESPTLMVLSETRDYWPILQQMVRSAKMSGPLVHDARVAAICVAHGVSRLWTADRDFSRFPELSVENPLAKS